MPFIFGGVGEYYLSFRVGGDGRDYIYYLFWVEEEGDY